MSDTKLTVSVATPYIYSAFFCDCCCCWAGCKDFNNLACVFTAKICASHSSICRSRCNIIYFSRWIYACTGWQFSTKLSYTGVISTPWPYCSVFINRKWEIITGCNRNYIFHRFTVYKNFSRFVNCLFSCIKSCLTSWVITPCIYMTVTCKSKSKLISCYNHRLNWCCYISNIRKYIYIE